MTTVNQNSDPSTQREFPRHQVFVVNTGGWFMSCPEEFCTWLFCFITNLSLISQSLNQRGFIPSTASSCGGKPMFSLTVTHMLGQSLIYFTLCHINTSSLLFRGDHFRLAGAVVCNTQKGPFNGWSCVYQKWFMDLFLSNESTSSFKKWSSVCDHSEQSLLQCLEWPSVCGAFSYMAIIWPNFKTMTNPDLY